MDKPIYHFTTDASEIIARTTNRVDPVFVEATRVVEGDNIQRSLAYLKSFANSIEKVSKERGRDKSIVDTAGNIKSLRQYETLTTAIAHLTEILGVNNAELTSLKSIHDSLIRFQAIYGDGYNLGIPLIVYEYEAASSTLIRGISALIVTQTDPQIDGLGKLRFTKVSRKSGGVFTKVAHDMAKELKSVNHEKYLKQLVELESDPELKADKSQVLTESATAAVGIAKTVIDILRYGFSGVKAIARFGKLVVRSMFGILPLIRTVIYLHYKRKADIISSLELQAHYIQLNIDQLSNQKTMDPEKKQEIIKKQQAYVVAYKKRAEKLRVELMDNERAGTEAMKEDDANIKPSDDYVLD